MARLAGKHTLVLVLCAQFILGTAYAEQGPVPGGPSYYQLKRDPTRPRATLLPPIVSFIIPGFDQWWEGQFHPATWYSLIGAGGILLSKAGKSNRDNRYTDTGMQLYFTAGAMSLFHSFRSAVTTLKPQGEFTFLGKDEPLNDLTFAPIQFSFLGRWSTLFPLASGLALFFLIAPKSSATGQPASFGDLFYSAEISYMTGVSEEMVFRGYLMPMLYQATGDASLSILVQGGAYALAHGLRFNHFITALGFGLYAGWIVEQQDYSIAEMIFVHTWLDVMAFLSDFAAHREHAFLRIPPISIRF